MHYYTFSTFIFANGQIRDAYNLVYKSDKPATVIEFKRYVQDNFAGKPDSFSGIIIPTWQEIDEETYNHINKNFLEENNG